MLRGQLPSTGPACHALASPCIAMWRDLRTGSRTCAVCLSLFRFHQNQFSTCVYASTLPLKHIRGSDLTMTSQEFVQSLYLLCLGRKADEAGLVFWLNFLQDSGDPMEVLARILRSDEYVNGARHDPDFISGRSDIDLAGPLVERPPIREVSRQFQRIESLPLSNDNKWRIAITSSCGDCDEIEKVPGAGEVAQDGSLRYQTMHNGVRVLEDCYYGSWMTELIRILRGHHEPQEEKVFHEVLKHLSPGSIMVELGSFWSYYSLWFRRSIQNATNVMVEPDPNNLAVGQRNFEINHAAGTFINAAVGRSSTPPALFICESDGVTRQIPCVSLDDVVQQQSLDRVDVLLVDTQGAELAALEGAIQCIDAGKLRFVFVSTHHHSISHDPLTHQRCLRFLLDRNAQIIAEHTVAESFSGDGLIVASFHADDREMPSIPISRNRASTSLFAECEFDLARAYEEIGRLKLKIAKY